MNYKARYTAISELLKNISDEKQIRLLQNGFIPADLTDSYNDLYAKYEPDRVDADNPIYKLSYSNYFAENPENIAGEMVEHSSLMFPVKTKGTTQDILNSINEIVENKKQPKMKTKEADTHAVITNKNEPVEDKTIIQPENPKETIDKKEVETAEIKPQVELSDKAIAILDHKINNGKGIKAKTLFSVGDSINEFDKNITPDEIIAWVWFKRKHGNPMNGWEDYYIAGGLVETKLIKTKNFTDLLDNKFVPYKKVEAGVILGKKTKFGVTYGEKKYIIVKTEQNELVWVLTSDIVEVSVSVGETQDELDRLVINGSLIYDGNEYYPAPVYFFGNIYERISKLKENEKEIKTRYSAEIFETQLNKAESYKPKMLSFADPVRSKRPHVLSLSEFANDAESFGITELNDEYQNVMMGKYVRSRFVKISEKISIFDAFMYYFEQTVKDTDLKNTTKTNIKNYYIPKAVRWPKDMDDKDIYTNSQKDEIVGNARQECERLFSDFLANALTYEDRLRLDITWNEKYNTYTSMNQFVDKIPIGFNCSTKFKGGSLNIKPAQRQGLGYLQMNGSGCLAYNVGFGKTATAILNIAQLMSQGVVKRPIIVVPKPVYKNWIREMFGYWTNGEKTSFDKFDGSEFHSGILTGTGIKFNDWYNLKGKRLDKIKQSMDGNINKLIPENTITLISFQGLESFGFSRDVRTEMIETLINVLLQKEAYEAMDAKEKTKEYEKLMAMVGAGNKNAEVFFDKCDFDHLTVDEAHNFKNVFPSCGKDEKTKRKLFGISSSVSTRGQKMFFLTQYLQAKHGKNVVLLTATPFTNSPLEIYSMLSYIGLHSLKSYGLYNIKKFFEAIVLETIEYAVDLKGEIITKPVIKSFQNHKLLHTILHNHFHYKENPEEAGIVRPCMIEFPNKDVSTYVEMSEYQRKNQSFVRSLVQSSKGSKNKGLLFKAMSKSLDNAFSPYLGDNNMPESLTNFVDDSPKIKYAVECIKSVKEYHVQRGESIPGMIIYSNRGVQLFPYIKDYLEEYVGYKKDIVYDDEKIDEVEIISGEQTDEDHKELVKDAFNAGVVKIIIGTSTIREGVNLQERGTAIFDLYPEWNPTDIMQLKGRIHRQGNRYGYVRFVMPLVINSMDAFIYQKHDEKSSRISDLWSYSETNVVENESSLSMEEIKYELVESIEEKAKIRIDTEVTKAERDVMVMDDQLETVKNVMDEIFSMKKACENIANSKIPAEIPIIEQNIELCKKYISHFDKLKKENKTEIGKQWRNDFERSLGYYEELKKDMLEFKQSVYVPALMIKIGSDIMRKKIFWSDWSLPYEYRLKDFEEIDTLIQNSSYQLFKGKYAAIVKAERSVLKAYGKCWSDNLDEIFNEINVRSNQAKEYLEKVKGEEFQKRIIDEVTKDTEERKKIRGNISEAVDRFAKFNMLNTYLADNTDRKNCPVPNEACCPINNIEVIHKDEEKMPEEEISVQSEPESKPDKTEFLTKRVKALKVTLLTVKDETKKAVLQKRLKAIELSVGVKMAKGGHTPGQPKQVAYKLPPEKTDVVYDTGGGVTKSDVVKKRIAALSLSVPDAEKNDLRKFEGDEPKNLGEIEISYHKDMQYADVKVTGSNTVKEFMDKIINKDQVDLNEQFYVLYLDRSNKIIAFKKFFEGGVSATVTDARIILAAGVKMLAVGIILVHNHPSRNTQPSDADKIITKKLSEAAKLIDMQVLDHVIITKDGYYSFADNGEIVYN